MAKGDHWSPAAVAAFNGAEQLGKSPRDRLAKAICREMNQQTGRNLNWLAFRAHADAILAKVNADLAGSAPPQEEPRHG